MCAINTFDKMIVECSVVFVNGYHHVRVGSLYISISCGDYIGFQVKLHCIASFVWLLYSYLYLKPN